MDGDSSNTFMTGRIQAVCDDDNDDRDEGDNDDDGGDDAMIPESSPGGVTGSHFQTRPSQHVGSHATCCCALAL